MITSTVTSAHRVRRHHVSAVASVAMPIALAATIEIADTRKPPDLGRPIVSIHIKFLLYCAQSATGQCDQTAAAP
jgi:hypothetical protein